MKKNCFYLISLFVSLCLFVSCSKSEDEPEVPSGYSIPVFELVDEDYWYHSVTYELNADAQTLVIVANSNMDEVRVETFFIGDDIAWLNYKEMVKKPEVRQLEFIFDIEANAKSTTREADLFFASPKDTDPVYQIHSRTVIVTQSGTNP